MKYCTDLSFDKTFCIFIFFHFPDSRSSVLHGLHFYFSLRDSSNRVLGTSHSLWRWAREKTIGVGGGGGGGGGGEGGGVGGGGGGGEGGGGGGGGGEEGGEFRGMFKWLEE